MVFLLSELTTKNSKLLTSHKVRTIEEKIADKNMSINQLVDLLLDDGIHILVIILIAPFLLPASIPGSSTPFGILIILLELSVLFNRKLYLPKMVSGYELSNTTIKKFFEILEKALGYIEKIAKPRGSLTDKTFINKINSILIIILALLLFLPLPIPLTDFVPAVSILVLSVSCLETDSYLLLIGYALTFASILYFYSIGYVGVEIIVRVLNYILNYFNIHL